MPRTILIISFCISGVLPLGLGAYLANREEYVVAIVCFIIAVCGFLQVYYSLSIQDDLQKDLEQQLEQQKEDYAQQKKQIAHNLSEIISEKIEQQQKIISRQQKELTRSASLLTQKNREIWELKNSDF